MSTRSRSRPRAGRLVTALAVTVGVLTAGVATAERASASSSVYCGFLADDAHVAKARAIFGQNTCPTSPTLPTANGRGTWTHFELNHASVFQLTSQGMPPFIVRNEIRDKWASMGWENSFLGFPVTDPFETPDTIGRFTNFEGGSIFWRPDVGAHFVRRAIRDKWTQLSGVNFLGFPTTDELATADTVGRFNNFERGAIYWKPNLGPHAIWGLNWLVWAQQGFELGHLGYPISDGAPSPANPADIFHDFENGVILFRAATNSATEIPPQAVMQPNVLLPLMGTMVQNGLALAKQLGLIPAQVLPFLNNLRFNPFTLAPGVLDYSRDANGVLHNRQERVTLHAQYLITDPVPDPTVDVTLHVELRASADGTAMTATILGATDLAVHVPFPASAFVSANQIADAVQQALPLIMNKELPIAPLARKPMSVKTLLSNNVNTF